MGQAQINVRTRACSRTFIARTKQAALTHHVRGKEFIMLDLHVFDLSFYVFTSIAVKLSVTRLLVFLSRYNKILCLETTFH